MPKYLLYSAKNPLKMHGKLPETYRVPAEWEPQVAVYLAAAPGNEFDPSRFTGPNRTVMDVHLAMIRALSGHVKVRVLGSASQEESYIKGMKSAGMDPGEVEFVPVAHCDIWLRDTGPIWAHTKKACMPVWLGFNNWGYYDYIEGNWATCDIPNFIPRDLGAYLELETLTTSLVGEGGDKSFNGKGSLICCKAVEKDRNPSLSFPEIEQLLKDTFNLKKVIWVEQGLADDAQTFRTRKEFGGGNLPGGVFTPLCTGGHVDEFCRFVGPSKVLLAQVYGSGYREMSPIEQITHFNMEGNLALLKEQTDQDGNPLEILRMPLPPSMIYTIDQRDPVYSVIASLKGVSLNGPIRVILAGSYCNYLVSNGVVCFPQYFQEGMDPLFKETDQKAMQVIQEAFPGHTIVPIDPKPVNAGGGGMHCISNNQPKI